MTKLLTTLLLSLSTAALFAQHQHSGIHINTDAGHLARLKTINRDVWTPFVEAYARGDAEAYMALHTPDVVRAGINEVKDFEGHKASSKRHFEYNKANNRRCEIAFTFFERVAGADRASERGVYRYTVILQDGERQHYYGKFHVIHRLQGGRWRIAVDYDSDENGTVGQADFEAGLPPDVFEKKGEMPAAETTIRKAVADFSAKVVAGDWAGVANAYTEDGAIFPGGMTVTRGRSAIEAFWRKGGKVNYHKVMPAEIVVQDGIAYDWGVYEGRSPDKDGQEATWDGKYIIVWKETAPGDWRVYLDCWNRLPANARPSMKKAIALDDSLGRVRNHACERLPLGATIRAYVAGMETINFTDCPPDFSDGFRQHIAAWNALLPFADQHPALRGEMHALFKQLESGPDGAAFKAAVQKVWDTWALVEASMNINGLGK